MPFHYETLTREFWVYSDPVKEAERLLALHEEVSEEYGEGVSQILLDARRAAQDSIAKPGEKEFNETVFVIARVHHAMGNTKKAIERLRLLFSHDPEHAGALDFLKEIDENNNPAPTLRSAAYRLLDQYRNTLDTSLTDKALKLVEIAMENDAAGEEERSYYICGAIYRDLGDTERAIEFITQALQVDPHHEPSHKLLARLDKDGAMIATKDRASKGYRPSPPGSPIREFMDQFQQVHNWHLDGPRFV